jgi:hypothetical protein
VEEEELMQGKAIQRVEEEELMQGKAVQRVEEEDLMQGKAIQRVGAQATLANNTGLPDNLKSGIENLSGMSMDHVQVHRNSAEPAKVQAHAYAQGSDIHIASGQEKHLAHEAWHVVQQAQGRVKPTLQAKGVAINDDPGLESEADVMGAKALQSSAKQTGAVAQLMSSTSQVLPIQRALAADRLNVVGERHRESDGRRDEEKEVSTAQAGGGYWKESEFVPGTAPNFFSNLVFGDTRAFADPTLKHVGTQTLNLLRNLMVLEGATANAPMGPDGIDALNYAWGSASAFLKTCKDGSLKGLIKSYWRLSEADAVRIIGIYPKVESDITPRMAALVIEADKDAQNALIKTLIPLIHWLNQEILNIKFKKEDAKAEMEKNEADREFQMHSGANSSSGQKGVWKIGNDHVTAIKAKIGNNTYDANTYNILTRPEFTGILAQHAIK